jgi:hypothetical protein
MLLLTSQHSDPPPFGNLGFILFCQNYLPAGLRPATQGYVIQDNTYKVYYRVAAGGDAPIRRIPQGEVHATGSRKPRNSASFSGNKFFPERSGPEWLTRANIRQRRKAGVPIWPGRFLDSLLAGNEEPIASLAQDHRRAIFFVNHFIHLL